MTPTRATIADNVRRVRDQLAAAALAARRDPAEVTLVAVSKYVDSAAAAELLAAGCFDLGESRPQELWSKASVERLQPARWHLIGPLQRNKIRRTLPLTTLIHSIDDLRLLSAIDAEARQAGLAPQILLEVNCSGETAKQGFAPDELRSQLAALEVHQHVKIVGLMTMAPLAGGELAARRTFAALRQLRDRLAVEASPAMRLTQLSMGMSGDFAAAIAEGATLVRIGSALFEETDGKRD